MGSLAEWHWLTGVSGEWVISDLDGVIGDWVIGGWGALLSLGMCMGFPDILNLILLSYNTIVKAKSVLSNIPEKGGITGAVWTRVTQQL